MQQHFRVPCIKEIIESSGDEELISLCSKRIHDHVQREGVARLIPGCSKAQEVYHGLHGQPPVTPEQKRHLVERMAVCDGPLACHMLQRSLERYVSTCVGGPPEKQTTELKGWLMPVIAVIVDCLEQVREKTVATLTTTRRLRCATFLLQLCSTILKTGRGSSHPERAEQPSNPSRTSTGDTASEGNHRGASADNNCEDGYMPVADACAELASECLSGIVENASEIMRKYRLDATGGEVSAETCGRVDIMFWVLSLASDVVKHFARRRWTCEGGTRRVFPEREARLGNKTVLGISASQVTRIIDDARHTKVPIGNEASSEIRYCLNILDISSLVRVMIAVPIDTGSHMMDVALKWLEVAQLLADAAEAMASHSNLEILFGAVPASLWQMSGPSRSLLPAEHPTMSPGAALIDPDGASGPLSQAMLRLVFWMIQLHSEGRFLVPRQGVDGGSIDPGNDKADGIGRAAGRGLLSKEIAVPWQSAVEALAATCDASCLDELKTTGNFDERLTHVFCDQDDALVDMLLTNLRIYQNVYPQGTRLTVGGDQMDVTDSGVTATSLVLRNLYRRHLHPASLFACLLSNIGFDSGVLLDWLISPETSFLQYLTLFLRQAAIEWSDFATRMSGVSLSLDEQGDSGDATASGDDDELILSEEQAERLARVISCLSGLAASVRGLQSSRLLPYNPAPLLRRIDEMVELYEQCGDADECDISSDCDMSDG